VTSVSPGAGADAEPFSSGARWNLMAPMAPRSRGQVRPEAQAYLKQLLGAVVLQAPAASDSMTAFTQGKGGPRLRERGHRGPEAGGRSTTSFEGLIRSDADRDHHGPGTTAQDFVKWLYTPEAQQIWATTATGPS
jgi:ABC-type sulfate transport system substrate-binding protein